MAWNISNLVLSLACLITVSANWTIGEWSGCSKPCGNGTMTRDVSCTASVNCDESSKPSTSTWCRGTSCPWDVTRVSGWEDCNNGCGMGLQYSKPACNCPMPCYLPDNKECKDTPLPPASGLLKRKCFGSASHDSAEFCTNCSASGESCLECGDGFKLEGGRCKVIARSIRKALSLKASSQLLSPMSRAVALVKATEKVVSWLANASTSVVSVSSKAAKPVDFLSVRRLGDCKKSVRVESDGGGPPHGWARFYLDNKQIPFPEEHRGFSVVVIDPDTLKVATKESFDIYKGDVPLKELTSRLNSIQDGEFVLIGVNDSGLEDLNNASLQAFHRVGAALQGFGNGAGFRQPYAFIGQVGEPSINETWAPKYVTVAEGSLPCPEPSIVEMVLVAQPVLPKSSGLTAEDADSALEDLAKRLNSLKSEDVSNFLFKELSENSVTVPDDLSSHLEDGMSELCPEPMRWSGGKCEDPGSGSSEHFPWWLLLAILASACLLCCLGACLYKRCKHREGNTLLADSSNQAQARLPHPSSM